jgi:hypothetical protein
MVLSRATLACFFGDEELEAWCAACTFVFSIFRDLFKAVSLW